MDKIDLSTWPVNNASAAVISAEGRILAAGGATDRRFRLASLTKLMTALAILIAVEEESLSLDSPAGPAGSTVRHLLCHTSGLTFNDDRIGAKPERRRIYSNTGYRMLGQLLAEGSGLDFETYLSEAVLLPLGMRDTALDEADPAAGAWGTVDDLVRFAAELMTPTLISAETHVAMTTPHFEVGGVLPGVGRFSSNPWGLGPEIRGEKTPHWTGSRNSAATYGHFGGSGTFLWIDPLAGLGCVAVTDRPYDTWAIETWPLFSDDVLVRFGSTDR